MALKYRLSWKTIDMPVRLEKATSGRGLSGYGIKAKMVCPKCEGEVRQVYQCFNCHSNYDRGDLTLRRDEDTGVIFQEAERKAFMQNAVDKVIRIDENGEIPLMELSVNLLSIGDKYEIYNNDNDKYMMVMAKIYNYMIAKGVGLLCRYGYYGRNRAGLLIPAHDRIVLCELVSQNLIKPAKQLGIVQHDNQTTDRLLSVATETDTQGEDYMKFIELKMNGGHVEVKAKEEVDAKIDDEAIAFLEVV